MLRRCKTLIFKTHLPVGLNTVQPKQKAQLPKTNKYPSRENSMCCIYFILILVVKCDVQGCCKTLYTMLSWCWKAGGFIVSVNADEQHRQLSTCHFPDLLVVLHVGSCLFMAE